MSQKIKCKVNYASLKQFGLTKGQARGGIPVNKLKATFTFNVFFTLFCFTCTPFGISSLSTGKRV